MPSAKPILSYFFNSISIPPNTGRPGRSTAIPTGIDHPNPHSIRTFGPEPLNNNGYTSDSSSSTSSSCSNYSSSNSALSHIANGIGIDDTYNYWTNSNNSASMTDSRSASVGSGTGSAGSESGSAWSSPGSYDSEISTVQHSSSINRSINRSINTTNSNNNNNSNSNNSINDYYNNNNSNNSNNSNSTSSGERWWIGGSNKEGTERFYLLQSAKRVSSDGISIDRLSL